MLAVLAFLAFRPGKGWLRWGPRGSGAPAAAHATPAGKGWQGAVKAAGSWGLGNPELGCGGIKSGTEHLVDTHIAASRLSHWSVR